MAERYRALVVDDSAFMRRVVSDIIQSSGFVTVAGTAANGAEALEAARKLRPDVITLDVEMPVMTGPEALPLLLKEFSVPVIMLSSTTQESAKETIRALELGAFDFVAKPSGANANELPQMKQALLASLRAAVQSREERRAAETSAAASRPEEPSRPVPPGISGAGAERARSSAEEAVRKRFFRPPGLIGSSPVLKKEKDGARQTKPHEAEPERKEQIARNSAEAGRPAPALPLHKETPPAAQPERGPGPPPPTLRSRKRPTNRIVAIGTSTGGPRALQKVLSQLPEGFPAALLIVQHMPPGFTRSLAQRLNMLCAIDVMEAEDGMEPLAGTAYIAPGGLHMVLRKEMGGYRIRLTADPPMSGHRPSADKLFYSLAEIPGLDITAVLMTGMGSDGARGMKELFDKGIKRTIAQDAASCIVYGMPRAAVELGGAAMVVPLDRIADQIMKFVS